MLVSIYKNEWCQLLQNLLYKTYKPIIKKKRKTYKPIYQLLKYKLKVLKIVIEKLLYHLCIVKTKKASKPFSS